MTKLRTKKSRLTFVRVAATSTTLAFVFGMLVLFHGIGIATLLYVMGIVICAIAVTFDIFLVSVAAWVERGDPS